MCKSMAFQNMQDKIITILIYDVKIVIIYDIITEEMKGGFMYVYSACL